MSKWRWPSWAILGWFGVGMAILVFLSSTLEAWEAGYRFGQFMWIWVIGFVVAGVVWRQTRPGRPCRWCGMALSVSTSRCPRCGYFEGMPGVGTCPNCSGLLDARVPQCPRCGFVPGPGPVPAYPPTYPPAPPQE